MGVQRRTGLALGSTEAPLARRKISQLTLEDALVPWAELYCSATSVYSRCFEMVEEGVVSMRALCFLFSLLKSVHYSTCFLAECLKASDRSS